MNRENKPVAVCPFPMSVQHPNEMLAQPWSVSSVPTVGSSPLVDPQPRQCSSFDSLLQAANLIQNAHYPVSNKRKNGTGGRPPALIRQPLKH